MKKSPTHWNFGKIRIILLGLIFRVTLCLCDTVLTENRPNIPESVALQEAQVARASAERRAVALELELEKLQKDYDALRSRYAELYIQSHATVDRLRTVELNAAHLIQKKSELDEKQVAQQALEALNLALSRQVQVYQALDEFEKYITTLLDVLQPSDAIRRETSERTAALKHAVEQSLKPLSVVARRGSERTQDQGATILQVHKELQIAILDKGLLSGIRPGQRWHLTGSDGKVVARLQTVDCRQEFSAAVILNGSLDQMGPGTILMPE
ncbi:MAG: hypothetical protein IJJ26_06895 [Victivallales bacterium]|nr:hypothetical protein [Victivallales bacterium]